MKRRKVSGGGAVTKLPDDIIFEILIRVSCATSLWEFRCVCKSWCSMISSPNFIQSHLNNSLLTSNFALISNTFHKPTSKILPLRTFLYVDGLHDYYSSDITHKDAIEVDCPVFKNYDDDPQLPVPVISTCNGLCLMLVNKRDFYLWNPFIKQVRKLPDFIDHMDLLELPDDYTITIRFGAFGFDDRSHDYNIVAYMGTYPNKNFTKFYSLKTDSWTRLEDFECTSWHGRGQFLNGEVHWLMACFRRRSLMIVSLDLSSQVQRTVDIPNNLGVNVSRHFQDFRARPQISVHGGCLYVLCVFIFSFDIWVLEDNDSSWVKVATMQRDGIGYCPLTKQTKILCVTEDGGFLLTKESQDIVVYKPKSDSYTFPFFRSSFPHADVCIQSLVSPFPDGLVKKECQTRYNESQNRSSERTKSQMARSSKCTKSQMARSSKRTQTQMARPTRRSPSTVYLPASSTSSLRRSPRLHHRA